MTRVWRNGRLVPGDATPGVFAEGARLFETVAVRGGKVERLDDHLARLRAGLDQLGLPRGPLAAGDLAEWRRAYAALGGADGILRLVVGDGFEELGIRPELPSAEVFGLRTLRTRRDDPEWYPRPKSAPWANSLAATRELRALAVPAGIEGVQLDARGRVSEATRSSLAWLADGRWHVPAAETGRLPGTALAQFVATCLAPVAEVAVPPPRFPDAVVILRSTLPGGGAPVVAWADEEGREHWQATDLAVVRSALARLAAYRAQRSVSLA